MVGTVVVVTRKVELEIVTGNARGVRYSFGGKKKKGKKDNEY